MRKKEPFSTANLHNGAINDLAISNDGMWIISGGEDS